MKVYSSGNPRLFLNRFDFLNFNYVKVTFRSIIRASVDDRC